MIFVDYVVDSFIGFVCAFIVKYNEITVKYHCMLQQTKPKLTVTIKIIKLPLRCKA